jgi:hypothetical protein
MTTSSDVNGARIAAAAASIEWPPGTAVLLNPDPLTRKKFAKRMLVISAVVIAVLIAASPTGPIRAAASAAHNNQLRPVMVDALAHGNRAAGTWLAMNFSKDYPNLLAQEVAARDPMAMYVAGSMLLNAKDPERYLPDSQTMSPAQRHQKGLDLIHAAADAGNLDAVVFLGLRSDVSAK